MNLITWIITIVIGIAFFSGIRIVRPTHKMLVETLGKYKRTAEQGFNYIVPIIQSGRYVNITEQMVDIPPQMVTTSDKLNMTVDAVVYYKVEDVKASEYNVDNHKRQLTSLSRTTLRAVMGKMSLQECIQKRDQINSKVESVLSVETKNYGVDVLRVEVQRIEPPKEVQSAMNEVVTAEQEKLAAKDRAIAKQTEADGDRMAAIKVAEGTKQASILEAEGKAKAFKLVRAEFKDEAQVLKRLEVTQASLENNSKVILTEKGINPTLLIGELPLKK